jgi:aspartate/methionine/tyrosine aminotransferase
MEISQRSKIDPFIVMDIMERAQSAEQEGRKVVHMEVGQPGTAAPKIAREFLKSFMATNAMGYTVALGLTDLRKKIAELYGLWYDLDIDWNRIVITSGSSAGFVLAFTALFDNFAKVGLANPGYPSYRQIMKALSVDPILINTTEKNKFQPTIRDLLSLNIEGLLIASPGNPTGCMIDREPFKELVDYCKEKKISLISDEIYHGIQYDKKQSTALEFSDECYVINSFSKYFSMTGWRIGWMVVPKEHVRVIERIQQNMFICASHASQILALGAFESKNELDDNLKTYRNNRKNLLSALPEMGLKNVAPPDGAFYLYIDISEFSSDSLDFAKKMLDIGGVAITPGVDFDPIHGKSKIRISYARSSQEILEGIKRIKKFMNEKKYLQ